MKLTFYVDDTSVSVSFPFTLPDSILDCVDVEALHFIEGFSSDLPCVCDSSVCSEDGFRSLSFVVSRDDDSHILFDVDNR